MVFQGPLVYLAASLPLGSTAFTTELAALTPVETTEMVPETAASATLKTVHPLIKDAIHKTNSPNMMR
jgi:hypothetical protein